jgi:serine/threonine protein phosphatase PrpC
MHRPEFQPMAEGEAAVFTSPAPAREGPNEDVVALLALDERRGLLLLADGFGGHPSGHEAAALAVNAVAAAVDRAFADSAAAGSTDNGANGGFGEFNAAILTGFDSANIAVIGLGLGAATTLVAVELWDDWIRPYHVGDSEVLVTGQRGKLKLRTTSHSPVGYAVEAGVVDADDALHHEERHLVSNMVGSPEMRIEVGAPLRLAPLDTLLLGSDGLFDNLKTEEILARVRMGPLLEAVAGLAADTAARMLTDEPEHASKPDDLSLIAYRLSSRGKPAPADSRS